MKKLFFLFGILCMQVASAQAPDPDFNDKMAFSEGQSHLKSMAFIEAPENASSDLVYQRLNLEVDPAVSYIAGSVLSKVKILKENITELKYDLSSALTVDSIYFDQGKINYQHTGDKIIITLPATVQINSYHQTEVFYKGAPPQTGFGSFMASSHNNTPGLWTLSEPYGASDWWPCKQSLSDKIDSIDVYITCPSQYKGASNGKLISDIVTGTKRTAHWKHRYPIATYLVAIAVTNYATYSDFVDVPEGEKIEILNYVYPEYLITAQSRSAEILSIMGFYNSKLITYPFAKEKYGHAQFGWGGGMEHQTMSFMASLEYELVAHEMAHQWFGDCITLASWHDIWLNEGFATYMTGLVYENLQAGYFWPIWKSQQIDKITASAGGSVYVADTTNISSIFDGRLSYSKGAYLLQMLRWEMGDVQFFKGLKDYLTDPTLAYGYASQEKFVHHMELAGDTTFTEFFNDWYYGQGYPTYSISEFMSSGKQMIKLSQVTSDPSVTFFKMHVPIRFWKDGTSHDVRLYNTTQDQEFAISDQKVDSIQFDPQKWLCAKVGFVLAVPEISKPVSIQIIPEYSTHSIRIILPDIAGGEIMNIYDLNGRTVFTGLLKGKDSYTDISSLKKGMYIVEVQSKNNQKKEKIVISN